MSFISGWRRWPRPEIGALPDFFSERLQLANQVCPTGLLDEFTMVDVPADGVLWSEAQVEVNKSTCRA